MKKAGKLAGTHVPDQCSPRYIYCTICYTINKAILTLILLYRPYLYMIYNLFQTTTVYY